MTESAGLQERIGVSIEGDPVPGANFIAWNAVQDLAPGVVTVSDTAGG